MTALDTRNRPLETVNLDITGKDVRYAVRWSDNVLMYGHGIFEQDSAEKWFTWLRDIKFRYGIPTLVEAIDGHWVEVPLGIQQVAKQA